MSDACLGYVSWRFTETPDKSIVRARDSSAAPTASEDGAEKTETGEHRGQGGRFRNDKTDVIHAGITKVHIIHCGMRRRRVSPGWAERNAAKSVVMVVYPDTNGLPG